MPKLTPRTKKLRDKAFLKALEVTGSPTEAAKIVSKIGSRGGKDLQNIAESLGSQKLSNINSETMAEYLEKAGITKEKVAGTVGKLLNMEYDALAMDKGITQAMKMGLGGGYTPEKSVSVNLEVNTTNPKALEVAKEYEQKLKETLD